MLRRRHLLWAILPVMSSLSGAALAQLRGDLTDSLLVCAAADLPLLVRLDQLVALGWSAVAPAGFESAAGAVAPYHAVLNRDLLSGGDWDQDRADAALTEFTDRLQGWFAAADPVNMPLTNAAGDILVIFGRTMDAVETRCVLATPGATAATVGAALGITLPETSMPPVTVALVRGATATDPREVGVMTFAPGAFTGVDVWPQVAVSSPEAGTP
jgi:hypothetical protein